MEELTREGNEMVHIDNNRFGRVYQSKDFNECYAFMELFGGEFSVDYYDDFIKGIFTVII